MALDRMTRVANTFSIFVLAASLAPSALGQSSGPKVLIAKPPADAKAVSISLEDLPHSHPVRHLAMTLYGQDGQDVRMGYMDVMPTGAVNGQTIVLMHGLNFFAEAWAPTIEVFRKEGYRVVALDQIGFGRSSKPDIPYTLNDIARNSKAVLDRIGVSKAVIPNFPALAKRSADSIPGAQLVLIPNVGHNPHMEAPELFFPPTLKFLKAGS